MDTQATPPRGESRYRRWLAWIGRIEIGLGSLAIAVIFVMVLIQAIQRYTPWEGLAWTGELARFCLVWASFAVAGVLLTREEHITLQLVDGMSNRKVVTGVHVFALGVVALVGLGGMLEAINLVRTQGLFVSPAMRLPMNWVYVIPALGFASLMVRGVVGAYQVARDGAPEPTLSESVGAEGGMFE